MTTPNILKLLGIPPISSDSTDGLAAYSEGSTITTSDYFQYLCTADGRTIAPRVLSIYIDLVGIMSFSPDPKSAKGATDPSQSACASRSSQSRECRPTLIAVRISRRVKFSQRRDVVRGSQGIANEPEVTSLPDNEAVAGQNFRAAETEASL